jgi:hypothetical protein
MGGVEPARRPNGAGVLAFALTAVVEGLKALETNDEPTLKMVFSILESLQAHVAGPAGQGTPEKSF